MRSTKLSKRLQVLLAIGIASLLMTWTAASAQTEKVLHNFQSNGGAGGSNPMGGAIFGKNGSLYGTTYRGGTYFTGTVFSLTPKTGGGWTEQVVHIFNVTNDGSSPAAGVVSDSAGNLYGTTYYGGVYNSGTVFELIAQSNGTFKEKILHSFNESNTGGAFPDAGLVFDSAGNLYGTTLDGGSSTCSFGCGVVFELVPQANGNWTEKVVHPFTNNGVDGVNPLASLVLDGAGNLYGTTSGGGAHGQGTVFELSPNGSGGFTEKVLYSFANNGTDGYLPAGNVVLDVLGNVYGATQQGGAYTCGAVFELIPVSGSWTENILYSFACNQDGAYPDSGLIFDAAGNLYGTTLDTQSNTPFGTAFKLIAGGSGSWTKKTLHTFVANGRDGYTPAGGLILDSLGNLYGTTGYGGMNAGGIVFEITP
jgi:uncharacterized repeat protein (TIGR03803 family)